jgi:hypothetical protein
LEKRSGTVPQGFQCDKVNFWESPQNLFFAAARSHTRGPPASAGTSYWLEPEHPTPNIPINSADGFAPKPQNPPNQGPSTE